LFRTTANKKLVDRLKVAFDRNGDVDLEAFHDVHAAAALLKLFLREMPEPAITDAAATDMFNVWEGTCKQIKIIE
jgi:hypothetical protein